MKKRTADEGVPESDCVEDAPHPRHNHLLFGHGDAERQLLEAYRSGRLPQAWIIGGQEGVGKATSCSTMPLAKGAGASASWIAPRT